MPIRLTYTDNNIGRISVSMNVKHQTTKIMTPIKMKFDTGSDFTTISQDDLYDLGYDYSYLKTRPYYQLPPSAAASSLKVPLQHLNGVDIQLDNQHISNCVIYFALDCGLRSLLGADILKYFNHNINRDDCYIDLSWKKQITKGISKKSETDMLYIQQSDLDILSK